MKKNIFLSLMILLVVNSCVAFSSKNEIEPTVKSTATKEISSVFVSSLATPEITCDIPSIYSDINSSTFKGCSGPCWEGIMPGITSSSEALRILGDNHFIEQSSLEIRRANFGGVATWQWCGFQGGTSSIIWGDVVKSIFLTLNNQVELSAFVAIYGDPEAVLVFEGGLPEDFYWSVNFYYPAQGIVLYTQIDQITHRIEPTTKVIGVEYFQPGSLEQYVRFLYNGQPDSESNVKSLLGDMESWKGYVDVMVYLKEDPN